MSSFKEQLADIGCHIQLGSGTTILRQKTERQSIDQLIMDQRDRLNKKSEKEYRDLEKRFENSLASVFRQESTDAHNVFSAMIAEERAMSNKAFLQVTGKSDAHLMNGAEKMRSILKHLQSQFDM